MNSVPSINPGVTGAAISAGGVATSIVADPKVNHLYDFMGHTLQTVQWLAALVAIIAGLASVASVIRHWKEVRK